MTIIEFSSKEVEKLTKASLPMPSEDMVGKYFKIPYQDDYDPNMPASEKIPKAWKQGVFKLTEKQEWSFIGIGLIQPG